MKQFFVNCLFAILCNTFLLAQDTLQFDWQQRINQTNQVKNFIQTGEEAAHAGHPKQRWRLHYRRQNENSLLW